MYDMNAKYGIPKRIHILGITFSMKEVKIWHRSI